MPDDVKQAWDEVGQRFSSLGRTMREHYQGATAHDRSDASAVRDALDRLGAAVTELAERTGELVKDDEIRGQTKAVAGSLERAISATADQIAQAIDELVRRGKDKDGGTGDDEGSGA